MKPAALLLFLLAAALLPAGCASDPAQGYAFSRARPDSVRSVRIDVFANQTYQHGVERELTDAVIKEVQRQSNYVVVQADSAETLLTGTITEVRLIPLSTSSRTGMVQDVALAITVDFAWKDQRSGKEIVARRSFRAVDNFVPEQGTSERIETGRAATVQRAARAIVNELRSSW